MPKAFIPYGTQSIDEADLAAVRAVLQSDYLTQGPAIPAFEKALMDVTGACHALAVNSATSALHMACLALGVGKGDVVWTSPISFVASANCALYCGADVDFVDIDPASFNMCPHALRAKLIAAKTKGRLPKVVIPVHMCGTPCDMKAIHALSQEFGFAIIEDASHAVGALHDGVPVGRCAHSHMTIFSFHPVKIITTGEGGAVLTQSDELAQKMGLLRSHGITRDPALMQAEPEGAWVYEQIGLGFNYRLSDIQAALGSSQMQRLQDFLERRHALKERYDQILKGLPLSTQLIRPVDYSSLHLQVLQLDLPIIGKSRKQIYDAMKDAGIGVNVHYIPIHLQPFYQAMGFKRGDYPHAEAYYERALTIPLHPAMSDADQDRVVIALKAAID